MIKTKTIELISAFLLAGTDSSIIDGNQLA